MKARRTLGQILNYAKFALCRSVSPEPDCFHRSKAAHARYATATCSFNLVNGGSHLTHLYWRSVRACQVGVPAAAGGRSDHYLTFNERRIGHDEVRSDQTHQRVPGRASIERQEHPLFECCRVWYRRRLVVENPFLDVQAGTAFRVQQRKDKDLSVPED